MFYDSKGEVTPAEVAARAEFYAHCSKDLGGLAASATDIYEEDESVVVSDAEPLQILMPELRCQKFAHMLNRVA